MLMSQTNQRNLISGILEHNDDYVDMMCHRMVLAFLDNTGPQSKLGYKICKYAEKHFLSGFYGLKGVDCNFPREREKKDKDAYYKGSPKTNSVNEEDWKELQKFHKAQVAMYTDESPEPDNFVKNLRRMGQLIGFSDVQLMALEYVYAMTVADQEFRDFFDDVMDGQSEKVPALIAMAIGRPDAYDEIAKSFGGSGTFMRNGIIDYDDEMNSNSGKDLKLPVINDYLLEIFRDRDISDEHIVETLLGKVSTTDLTIEDNFAHMQDDVERILQIVKAATERGEKGINIALYGPTGSGKTEFVRAIAKHMNKRLYAIGEQGVINPQFSDEPKRTAVKRMRDLHRAGEILEGQDDVLLFMDEFEDLVPNSTDSSKQADPDSKIELNNTLTDNTIVTFWACNDIGKFHNSFRSRFFTSVFVGYQPTMVRKQIWGYHAQDKGLDFSDEQLLGLARAYEAPPRAISNICRAVSMLGGDFKDIVAQVEDRAKMLKGHRRAFETDCLVPPSYDLDLLVSDVTAKDIHGQILSGTGRQSLLISGEGGTGRSTFAYYIAETMVRAPIVADARDLVTPSQFAEPYQKLDGAFGIASDTKGLLIIDNFDALFHNVDGKDEESIQATFWDCMQKHQLPMVFLTSNRDRINSAVLEYMDMEMTLKPLDEPAFDLARRCIIGNVAVPFNDGATLADLSRVAAFNGGGQKITDEQAGRRLKASAGAPSARRAGFQPRGQ
jgi:energy-coupling factor transporter ATP-binding protein EcfA2